MQKNKGRWPGFNSTTWEKSNRKPRRSGTSVNHQPQSTSIFCTFKNKGFLNFSFVSLHFTFLYGSIPLSFPTRIGNFEIEWLLRFWHWVTHMGITAFVIILYSIQALWVNLNSILLSCTQVSSAKKKILSQLGRKFAWFAPRLNSDPLAVTGFKFTIIWSQNLKH